MELPYDPAIPLLDIYPEKSMIWKDICTPVFTAALFTIAKTRKQLKCPSTEEWIKKTWCIYTMEYSSVVKNNEIMPFAATWMYLGTVILSEISQTKKEKCHMMSLIFQNLKSNDIDELTYKTVRNSQTQRMNLWLLVGGMEGRDRQGLWDGHIHSVIFKMNNQGPAVQHMELCSILCGILGAWGVWGRMDTYM